MNRAGPRGLVFGLVFACTSLVGAIAHANVDSGALQFTPVRMPESLPEKPGAHVPAGNSGLQQPAPASAISNQFSAEIEPNNDAASATPIVGSAAALEGNTVPNGDVDVYSFTAAAGDRVHAATMTSRSSSASVDSVLELLAADGVSVLETDDNDGSFGATSSSIAGASIPSAGTYYLRVRHAVATNQLRPYRLYFQLRSGAPVAETEPNDASPGQAMPAGGWVSGNTAALADMDFYTLNLNAGDSVFLSLDLDPERDATEWNAQFGLGTFGTPPQILVVNDAGAAAPDSEAFFMTVKDTGSYGVFVGLPAGGTTFGTYQLSATVFPKLDDGVNCTTYTSTDVPVAIPGGPGIVSSTLVIPGNPRIEDIDVSVRLTHAFMADLDVELTAPGGNTVGLFSDIGSTTAGAQTTMDLVLDDEAAIPPLFAVTQGMRLAPELNYSLGWLDGQPAGGAWTLTLRDDAAGDGGSLEAWSLRVCEMPPPPACPAGFTEATAFATDFETGAAGFTHSGTQDEWELGTPTFAPVTDCNSGSNCWKTDLDNSYNASSSQDLLSASIDLTGLSPPIVVGWAQKYQMESANFDHYQVEAREVGVPANAVRLFDFLGADMINNAGNPAVAVQEAAGWGQTSVRADALAGTNMELRFHLDSDTTVQRAGVAIDDVSVSGCRAISTDLAITKTDGVSSAVPGESVTYTITASNAGPDSATAATVVDTFPVSATCAWTCVGAGGGTCTAAGAGNINDTIDLPAGASATYTASCSIAANAVGTLDNTATVATAGGTGDPQPGNNSATDSDTLTPQADLAVTKTDGVTTATPGGSVTYTISASNAGPSDAPGVIVADAFPAVLACSWTCAGAGGGTCTAAGSGAINDAINLPAGGSTTHTATCTIDPVASGSLANTATVGAPAGVTDPNPANNSATDTDTLSPSADLAITKTDGVTSATSGSATTYTIVASNAGPSAIVGATVADTFPAACSAVNWTCASAGGGSCAAAGTGNINDSVNLPVGASVSYSAACTISASASGSLGNTATIAAPGGATDPAPANNSATDTDALGAEADLAISKTDGVTSATPGGTTTYTIVASNAGPSAVAGASVADTFPAACSTATWTCAGAAGGSCTAAGAGNINDTVNLPAGASVSYSAACAISASASGSLGNTATVVTPAGVTDPTPANNSATDTDALGAEADLAISKTDGVTTVTPGDSLSYTLVASNAGPSAVLAASVSDTFPAACVSSSWVCTGAGGATCAASGNGDIVETVDLPAGASATFVATCVTDAALGDGTLVSNAASIAAPASVTDPVPTNNSASDDTTAVVTGADVSATKIASGSHDPGGTVTYTIVLNNSGPDAQADNPGDEFIDILPLQLALVSATASSGTAVASIGGNSVSWNGAIAVGASVTVTIAATIDAAASGNVANQGWLSYDGDGNGSNESSRPTDDPAAAGTTDPTVFAIVIPAGADVSATKTVSGSYAPGSAVTYTIVLGNSGAGAQADNPGDEFIDILPPQLALVSATASSGTAIANIAGNSVTWNGAIAVGASVTFTITATIDAAASGNIANQGMLSYDGDGDGSNEAARATDDPVAGGSADPTVFAVAIPIGAPTPVPAGSWLGWLIALVGLAALAQRRMRQCTG